MKIKTPKFIRKIICHYISKVVEEETRIRTNIHIDSMTIDTKGRDYILCMSETISVNKKDLKRFIKESIKGRA